VEKILLQLVEPNISHFVKKLCTIILISISSIIYSSLQPHLSIGGGWMKMSSINSLTMLTLYLSYIYIKNKSNLKIQLYFILLMQINNLKPMLTIKSTYNECFFYGQTFSFFFPSSPLLI